MTELVEPADLEELRLLIGPVVDRWYRVGLLRFNSRDDGSDDLLLRDEIARAILPRFSAAEQRVAALEEGLRMMVEVFADGSGVHSAAAAYCTLSDEGHASIAKARALLSEGDSLSERAGQGRPGGHQEAEGER